MQRLVDAKTQLSPQRKEEIAYSGATRNADLGYPRLHAPMCKQFHGDFHSNRSSASKRIDENIKGTGYSQAEKSRL